jgi:hypothetical protein
VIFFSWDFLLFFPFIFTSSSSSWVTCMNAVLVVVIVVKHYQMWSGCCYFPFLV